MWTKANTKEWNWQKKTSANFPFPTFHSLPRQVCRWMTFIFTRATATDEMDKEKTIALGRSMRMRKKCEISQVYTRRHKTHKQTPAISMFRHQTLMSSNKLSFYDSRGRKISTSTRWVNLHHIRTSENLVSNEQRIQNSIRNLIIMQIDSRSDTFPQLNLILFSMSAANMYKTMPRLGKKNPIIFMLNDEGYVQC